LNLDRPSAPSALQPAGARAGDAPWFQVGGDAVRLLRDGAQAFPAMLEAIASAAREVLLEMYWIGADPVGVAFRDALAERARAGVTVRVIHDAVGSLGINEVWWAPLIAAGGHVAEYASISPLDPHFRLERIERRDHRKLLIVDGRRGFTGGINLASPWLAPEDGGAGWRDDMVEVTGEATDEMRTLFFRTWRKVTLEPPPPDVRPLTRRRTRPVWVLASQWRTRRSMHREYVVRIRAARHRVDIANSYFVPDRKVRAALFQAVRQGAEVRVLIPARGDVPVVQYASEALFDTLLRHGVQLWTLPGTMLHAKTAIIDDAFTTIGSYNLDERSWLKNLEINVAIEDAPFAQHVRRWFEHDLSRAVPVGLEVWRDRSLLRRGFEWASYALRRLW
jgi:cardiolipin synthase